MTRLIDADALLEELKEYDFSFLLENIYDLITNAPTIQREEQAKLTGWVSVEDRLPDFKTYVAMYDKNNQFIAFGHYTKFGWHCVRLTANHGFQFSGYLNDITHWQPLPAAPTDTEQ